MAGISVIFKAVDEISTRFDAMSSAGEKALDAFEKLETAADSAYSVVSENVKESVTSMDKAAKATDSWADAIENYDKEAMGAVGSTEEFVEMGFKAEAALEDAAKSVDRAAEEIEGFGKESKEAAKQSEEFGNKSADAIMSLDSILATVGVAVALNQIKEAFTACSDASAEFEVSMAQVNTIADRSILTSAQISQQISQLSTDSAQVVTDLAEATYGAISASIDTANAVGFVAQANELAVGGFTSQATSVDVLTTAINAYGKSAADATQISDYLVTTQNLGKTTVDQLASSIGMVIPTAAAFNVELDNLSTAYAILTANGVQTAQSTTYLKSMLSELADTESDVAEVLYDETGASFAQLMDQGKSLGDVMQVLGDSVGGNTTAFMNLWGSMEAGSGAVSLYNSGAEKYASVLDKMRNSAGATAAAYETMTDTTDFSTQRMENSFNNLSIAIGDDLNPTVRELQNGIADMTDRFTNLIKEHPAISAVLTGVAVGIGVVTVGVTGYVAVTKIATAATAMLGTTLNTAVWPLTLLVGSIAAVTAGIIYFTDKMEDVYNMEDHLVSSSRKMENELDDLHGQYGEAVEMFGRNSEQAFELKTQIDNLTESFNENKTTIGNLTSFADSLGESIEAMHQKYTDAITSNKEMEYSSLSLVEQLIALSSKSSYTGSELQVMQGIVDSLNGSYEDLNIVLDETSGKLNFSVDELYVAVTQAANQANKQAATDSLVQALQQFQGAREGYLGALSETSAAWDTYEILEEKWKKDHPIKAAVSSGAEMNWDSGLGQQWREWEAQSTAAESLGTSYQNLISEMEIYCRQLGYSEEETSAFIKSLEESSDAANEMADSISQNTSSQITGNEAVAAAVEGVQTQLEDLAQAYDDAYGAAYQSIDGQIGLFATMKTESEQSAADMQAAMESQVEYINTYVENLQKASEYGLSDGLISSLSDGSADSAGQLDAIISKIEQLGGTTDEMSEDAKAFVESFNTSFGEVDKAKDSFATSLAQMETDFADSVDAIGADMQTAIDNMNMADEASAAAAETMNAYIRGIKSKIGEVDTAFDAISFSIPKVSTKEPTKGFVAHAEGGIFDTPHYGVFAEAGPEAYIPIDGSDNAINIWKETGKQLGTYSDNDSNSPNFYVAPKAEQADTEGSGDRTITIRLEGAGELRMGNGGMSKEDVINVLIENLKDTLMSILQQEIMEEGELSYEF